MSKGKLLVLSGPSGVGKGTVLGELMKRRSEMCFSVSATTRAPRDGEEHGVNYFFLSQEQFKELIDAEGLLEYACYVDNYYGTPKAFVEQKLNEGMTVVLDIEVQGAQNVLKAMPEAISVYLIPPSFEELERRLRGRGTETESVIQGRLQRAVEEAKQADFYQYIVVNDNLEEAVQRLDAILTASHCSFVDNQNKMKEVFKL